MDPTQEFEITHTLCERYYLTAQKEQRVERTLTYVSQEYEEVIATEDYRSMSGSGALGRIKRLIRELESPTSKRITRPQPIDQAKKSILDHKKAPIVLVGTTVLLTVVNLITMWVKLTK